MLEFGGSSRRFSVDLTACSDRSAACTAEAPGGPEANGEPHSTPKRGNSHPMITGLDHVTVLVEDLAKAAQAYTALLGARPTYRGHDPELGTESVLFGLDNSLIELVAPWTDDERTEGMRSHLHAHGGGLLALAFSTEDASAFRTSAREHGLRASPPEMGRAHGEHGEIRDFTVVEVSRRDSAGLSLLAVQRADLEALRTRTQQGPDRPHALDHVVIRSAHPERAQALYGERLGLRLALDTVLGGRRMLFFRTGGVTIEVVEDPQVPSPSQDELWGLAYRVRDLEATVRRLGQAPSLQLSERRVGRKQGTEVVTVRDGTMGVPTLLISDPSREAGR